MAKTSMSQRKTMGRVMHEYAHGELIYRLDKYLGGGITATPYHEDLVGQIVIHARIAVRKQRLALETHVLVAADVTVTDLERFKMEIERLYRPSGQY